MSQPICIINVVECKVRAYNMTSIASGFEILASSERLEKIWTDGAVITEG